MSNDHDKRPPREAQVAEMQRLNAQPDREDEPALSADEVIDMYRHPDIYGFGCEDEGSWPHPDDTHDDPSRFTDDQLAQMHADAEQSLASLCLLHLDHRYPVVPVGVWGPQVDAAWDRLDDLTRQRTGKPAHVHEHTTFTVTADELRQTWDDHPHAAWWFEVEAEDGALTIEVVE